MNREQDLSHGMKMVPFSEKFTFPLGSSRNVKERVFNV